MPTPLVITVNFINPTFPTVTTQSIRIPAGSAHREVFKCAGAGDVVDVFDEGVGKRLRGTIVRKELFTNATLGFELNFIVVED